jgi:hypothetical protein
MKKFLFASLFAMLSFCAMAQVTLSMNATPYSGVGTTYNLNLSATGVPTSGYNWYSWKVEITSPVCGSTTVTTGLKKNVAGATIPIYVDCDGNPFGAYGQSITATLRQYYGGNPQSSTLQAIYTITQTGVHGKEVKNVDSKDKFSSTFTDLFTYQNNGNSGVKLTLLDVSGQTIVEQNVSEGATFETAVDRPSGIYLLRLEKNGIVDTRKLLKLH